MSVLLRESLALSESGHVRVDRERGILGPVKCLGWKSANGREYDPAGVEASLYEGKRVCVGHHRGHGERSPLDTYAYLEGCTKKADGVYAERLRLLNPKGDFEQRLLTAAESAPHLFMLSHTAHGTDRAGSRGAVIEAVQRVDSVDLVNEGATVNSLYESRNPPMKARDLVESLKATRPKYSRGLQEAIESGVMSPDAPMDAPPDAPAAEGDHEAAILDAAAAVLRDDALSVPDKLKKIKTLLKMTEGGSGGAADEPATEESRRRQGDANLREQLARYESRERLRAAADEAGVKLGKSLLESLRPLSEAEAKALVGELKGAGAGGQRPRSAAPVVPPEGKDVRESKTGAEPEIPADPKARAAWLRRG